MYWDGETAPSVEAPVGDFFGVGHGLDRNFSSLPINCSSEGRARNCYWQMPFRKSARITVTNEGLKPVAAFYYYVDYRVLRELSEFIPYFHAQYRQELPCAPGRNYLLLEAEGRGHYIGCNLSVIQRAMGWWGEGDDMIYVDGEKTPSLHGTGSEDYFSDAWGMRQDENLFYGCPLQEEDFQPGSKASVYRFHVPDPVPFTKSIAVTIEHGHANDRADDFSSVAYWYQTEPHKPFPALAPLSERLPYAFEPPDGLILPQWEKMASDAGAVFEDKQKGWVFESPNLAPLVTSFYGPDGSRLAALTTEAAQSDGAKSGTEARLTFAVEVREQYDIDIYLLKGPARGEVTAFAAGADGKPLCASLDGYSPEVEIAKLSLPGVLLEEGANAIVLRATGKNGKSLGADMALVGLSLAPADRRFIRDWLLIGPFDAPDMDYLTVAYPPEKEIALDKKYPGKGGLEVAWKKAGALSDGSLNLNDLFRPNEQAIIYGLAYVRSPDERTTHLLLGSDDGVRVWLNGEIVHSNPAYRGNYPDQDRIKVALHKGWNALLVKVLQGAGGWGFSMRLADPHGDLRYGTEPKD
jgi:D-arabinan exo alpha-(1,3)/(1,5)-arabinofuranosidase (non-reducing end)